MPQKSGMFDSTIDDPREYPAREFAEYFARFLTNGVFNGGLNLQVTALGTNANVNIAVGAAWIKGYAYSVYDSPLTLAVAPATTQDRIDRIILRLDTSTPVRAIKAMVLQGTPSASPTAPVLVRSGDTFDLSLAQVKVTANSSIVTQASITDERLNESVCGLVNSLIRVDTATFQQQWDVFLASVQNQGFATAASVDAKITTHNNVANAHGATSAATASKIMVRDAAGRAKIAVPSAADDIARLDTVTNVVGSLTSLQTTVKGNIVAALNELFTGAVNVKTKVANAINGKGGSASSSDDGDQLAAKIGQINTGLVITPGTIIVASGGSSSITGSTTTDTFVKGIKPNVGGTYRVSFGLAGAGSVGQVTLYGRIYVNGVPRGTQRQQANYGVTTYTEDITVNTGDEIQIWLRVSADNTNSTANLLGDSFTLGIGFSATIR